MIRKDLGFILKRYNFRETSLIANIYTLNFGKITGIFKGFYTIKKEFSSPLDIGSLNEFIFYPKRSAIWLVSYADLVNNYPFLSNDILKNRIASEFINLVDRVMQLWDVNFEVFYLLKSSLEYLENISDIRIIYAFLIKFFTISGLKPQLGKCVVCSMKLKDNFFFDVSRGGLICNSCKKIDNVKEITKETMRLLLYIQNNNFDLAFRLNLSLDSIDEINYILEKFLFYHLEYKIDLKGFIWRGENSYV